MIVVASLFKGQRRNFPSPHFSQRKEKERKSVHMNPTMRRNFYSPHLHQTKKKKNDTTNDNFPRLTLTNVSILILILIYNWLFDDMTTLILIDDW